MTRADQALEHQKDIIQTPQKFSLCAVDGMQFLPSALILTKPSRTEVGEMSFYHHQGRRKASQKDPLQIHPPPPHLILTWNLLNMSE